MVTKSHILRLMVCVGLLFSAHLSESQVIDIGNGEKVDCEYASGTLETALCSLHYVKQSEKELDSLHQIAYQLLDSLAIEQEKVKEEIRKEKAISQLQKDAKTHRLNAMTDYLEIKDHLKQSQKSFHMYVESQAGITGEMVGRGTGRATLENDTRLSLLYQEIKKLKSLLETLRTELL